MIELINSPYPWLLVKDGTCHHFITHRGELTEELWAVRGSGEGQVTFSSEAATDELSIFQ